MTSGVTKTSALSASVGDYLKAIWSVGRVGAAASTKDISGQLSVSPASVTSMLGRLQGMGLVRYERYRGASLTELGRSEALRLVRRHRLIEAFLLEHLGYDWQDVHEEAERLEHAVSDGFTERLATFLGHPERDPHGDPIPTPEGTLAVDDCSPLREAEPGAYVRIYKVSDESTGALDDLGERGLVPGRLLHVEEIRDLDGVVTVRNEDGGRTRWGSRSPRRSSSATSPAGGSEPPPLGRPGEPQPRASTCAWKASTGCLWVKASASSTNWEGGPT